MIRDPLDELGQQNEGLGQLFSDLGSPPLESELAGQQAALSMFLAVRAEQVAAEQAAAAQTVVEQAGAAATAGQTRVLGTATGKPSRRPPGSRRRPLSSSRRTPGSVRKARFGGRLVVGAMFVALVGGFAAAGYAAVLPAPLQRVAYQILGFAGVPDAPGRQSHLSHGAPVTSHAVDNHSPAASPSPSLPSPGSPRPSHHKSAKPKHTPKSPKHKHSPSPHPSSPGHPTGPVKIAIAASQQEITAGQNVEITAVLTSQGQPKAGIKVSLLEKAAGRSGQTGGGPGSPVRPGWRVVGSGATDEHGQATFTVSGLTANALFRVTAPGGSTSSRLPVMVIPPITASLESGPRPNLDLLVVSSPLAQHGDIVELEANVNGSWRVVRLRRIHKNGQSVFSIPLRKIPVTYQVVLPATGAHAESMSNQVTAPARIRHAKKSPGNG